MMQIENNANYNADNASNANLIMQIFSQSFNSPKDCLFSLNTWKQCLRELPLLSNSVELC